MKNNSSSSRVAVFFEGKSRGSRTHVIICHVILGSVSPKLVMQAFNYVTNDWPQCICYLQDNSYFLIFLENLNPLQSLVNLSEVWFEILLHIVATYILYSYNLRPQTVDLFVVWNNVVTFFKVGIKTNSKIWF
jgi:hypothetical protein